MISKHFWGHLFAIDIKNNDLIAKSDLIWVPKKFLLFLKHQHASVSISPHGVSFPHIFPSLQNSILDYIKSIFTYMIEV